MGLANEIGEVGIDRALHGTIKKGVVLECSDRLTDLKKEIEVIKHNLNDLLGRVRGSEPQAEPQKDKDFKLNGEFPVLADAIYKCEKEVGDISRISNELSEFL